MAVPSLDARPKVRTVDAMAHTQTEWPSPEASHEQVVAWYKARGAHAQGGSTCCPNCHRPHDGLIGTALNNASHEVVIHCGCFWKDDARGKERHASRTRAVYLHSRAWDVPQRGWEKSIDGFPLIPEDGRRMITKRKLAW